eukprot:s737_g24.t1
MTENDREQIAQGLDEIEQGARQNQCDVMIISQAELSPAEVSELFSLPRVSAAASAVGLKCGPSYDIRSGVDLLCKKERDRVRAEVAVRKPKLLVVCPPCGPFSLFQGLRKDWESKEWLKKLYQAKILLRFAVDMICDQIKRGDVFVFEQPHGAKSWQDVGIQRVMRMSGIHRVTMDQCMYGLRDRKNGNPHQQRTGIMTNSKHVAEELCKTCDGHHGHQHVMGQVKLDGKWMSRSQLAQEYHKGTVRALLRGFLRDMHEREQCHAVHCVLTVEALEQPDDKKVAMLLRRCHENLGHPSVPRFIGMLKAARATERCLQIAKSLKCATCEQFQGQKSHHVSKTTPIQHFNDIVAVDTFEVDLPQRKLKILNIIDLATHFQVCVPLWHGIEIRKTRKAYRRFWKRWAGPPRKLISDGGGEFGEEWTDALTRDGTIHDTTAAYSPWQNGVCERAGSTWKAAFQKAILELDPKGKHEVEEVCDHVTCARNALTRKEGYSPCQHVLGQDVRIPGTILEVERQEQFESALEQGEHQYERAHRMRLAARRAFLEADSDMRIRRAIGHRTRPQRGPFHPGNEVYIWRKSRGENRHHWHGPGRVIGAQSDKVWVAYGAKVYRCCPEQVRHQSREVQELASWIPENLRRHRSTLRERGAGNVVELDRQALPPINEQEEQAQENQVGERPSSDVEMEGNPRSPQEINEGNDHEERSAVSGGDSTRDDSHQDENMSNGVDELETHEGMEGVEGHDHESMGEVSDVVHVGRLQHESMDEHVVHGHGRDLLVDAHHDGAVSSESQYGPVRTTKLTHALRKSLDTLDFGRPPKSSMPCKHDLDMKDDALVCDLLRDELTRQKVLGDHDTFVCEDVFIAAMKKTGRKEVDPKRLSEERLHELDQAKAREWQKMLTSGAVKVHVGREAEQMLKESGKKMLETRFVYTTADGKESGALKARWCVKGFLDPDILDLDTASPTLSAEGFSIAAQVITSMRWKLRIADIEAAFLRGDDMSRKTGKVLVKVPKDGIPNMPHGAVIELVKPVYGLADAPKLWWQSLTRVLRDALSVSVRGEEVCDAQLVREVDPEESSWVLDNEGGRRLMIITLQKVRPNSALKSARQWPCLWKADA